MEKFPNDLEAEVSSVQRLSEIVIGALDQIKTYVWSFVVALTWIEWV